ncbi:MAG: hypothetical protein WC718_07805, partial [Phycisphaerales bacterium]
MFVFEVVGDDDGAEAGDAGHEVGGDETGAAADGGLDVVEPRGDVFAIEPEGEGFEGGFVLVGD